MQIGVYVINLARRTDRLAAMDEQLGAIGIAYQRIEAVLGSAMTAAQRAAVHTPGALGELSAGDIGCFLSHRLAWSAIVASGQPYGLILEDDVVVSPKIADCLANSTWIPADADIVKLDRHGNNRHVVLLSRQTTAAPHGALHIMKSKHCGCGCYIVSRALAQKALAATEHFAISVDHVLFNPNNSSFARQLRTYQLIPALARQGLLADDGGDIHTQRVAQRSYNFAYWKREAIRGFYELSQLPKIAWNLALGDRLTKITTDLSRIETPPNPHRQSISD